MYVVSLGHYLRCIFGFWKSGKISHLVSCDKIYYTTQILCTVRDFLNLLRSFYWDRKRSNLFRRNNYGIGFSKIVM